MLDLPYEVCRASGFECFSAEVELSDSQNKETWDIWWLLLNLFGVMMSCHTETVIGFKVLYQ